MEEDWLQSRGRNIGRVQSRHKRELGRRAMRPMQAKTSRPAGLSNVLEKKGSIRRWSLDDGAEAQSRVVAIDEGGGNVVCRGHRSREEETTSAQVSQIWTEGGGNGANHVDARNMPIDRVLGNGPAGMPAMRLAHRKVSVAALDHGHVSPMRVR